MDAVQHTWDDNKRILWMAVAASVVLQAQVKGYLSINKLSLNAAFILFIIIIIITFFLSSCNQQSGENSSFHCTCCQNILNNTPFTVRVL